MITLICQTFFELVYLISMMLSDNFMDEHETLKSDLFSWLKRGVMPANATSKNSKYTDRCLTISRGTLFWFICSWQRQFYFSWVPRLLVKLTVLAYTDWNFHQSFHVSSYISHHLLSLLKPKTAGRQLMVELFPAVTSHKQN